MPSQQRVVVLGGGLGAVYTAKYLWETLNREERGAVEIVLVSPENYLVFQPMLPEVVSGTLETLHVITPIRRIVPHATLYVRAVEAIDLANSTVRISPGYARRHINLPYDHLVLAVGTQKATQPPLKRKPFLGRTDSPILQIAIDAIHNG